MTELHLSLAQTVIDLRTMQSFGLILPLSHGNLKPTEGTWQKWFEVRLISVTEQSDGKMADWVEDPCYENCTLIWEWGKSISLQGMT